MEHDFELGGFAEDESVIDGDYDDLVAFNYCLACDYINAMYAEDFESIGEIDNSLIDNINLWYAEGSKKDYNELLHSITNCSMKTCQNRTLAEAIYRNRAYGIAYAYYLNDYLVREDLKKYIDLTMLLADEKEWYGDC